MNNVTVLLIAFGVAILFMLWVLYKTFHPSEPPEPLGINLENLSDSDVELSEEEEVVTDKDIKDSGLSRETILQVRRLYKKQKEEKKNDGSGWSFWDERVHVENLLCKRINYLILCYSLFVAAFATVNDRISKITTVPLKWINCPLESLKQSFLRAVFEANGLEFVTLQPQMFAYVSRQIRVLSTFLVSQS